MAQIMNSLLPSSELNFKKQGNHQTTQVRYDLNQIPYDYTVEVMNSSRDQN